MNLVYDKNSCTVRPGDTVLIADERWTVESIEKPLHPASTGRVYLQRVGTECVQGFFPGVIGAEWDERPDRVEYDTEHVPFAPGDITEFGHNSPEGTVAYVTEFNRLNGLKPLPFTFRGRTYC